MNLFDEILIKMTWPEKKSEFETINICHVSEVICN